MCRNSTEVKKNWYESMKDKTKKAVVKATRENDEDTITDLKIV